MNSAAGLKWSLTQDSHGLTANLPRVAKLAFPRVQGPGSSWGTYALWDDLSGDFLPVWRLLGAIGESGRGLPVHPCSPPSVTATGRGYELRWMLAGEGFPWASEIVLKLNLYHGSGYVECILSCTPFADGVVDVLPELLLSTVETAPAVVVDRGITGLTSPKHEIGTQRLFELPTQPYLRTASNLLIDVRLLESPDFTANAFVTAEEDVLRLHLGGTSLGLRKEYPYTFLDSRCLHGRWRLTAGQACVMRWLAYRGLGTCHDLIRAGIPGELWRSYVRQEAIAANNYLSWRKVIESTGTAISQLEAFPHAAGLDGGDAGIAPYKTHYCSDISQWFYQPQVYWPFILGMFLQGRHQEGNRLLDQLIERLWAYSRSRQDFRPVNALGSVTQLVASSYHWGLGILGLVQIWLATRDERIPPLLHGLIDPFLPNLPADNVPRFMDLEDFSFNTQPRFGTCGFWSVGLIALYRASGKDEYLWRAAGLLRGANAHLNDWRRMGGIEDWEGLKPDALSAAALSNFLLYEESYGDDKQASEWLTAGRDWAMAALSLVQVGEFNTCFSNAFKPFGPGVSNIGWLRGGEYPDSDGRCEASLETIGATNILLYATKYFDGAPLRVLLELAAVIRKTHLSYCLKGCNGDDSAISLLAHELHDNNTDILEPERWPLVTSYMTGVPNLEALIFAVVECGDKDLVCIERSLYLGDPGQADLIVYNPCGVEKSAEIKAWPAGELWRVKISLRPKEWRVFSFSRAIRTRGQSQRP